MTSESAELARWVQDYAERVMLADEHGVRWEQGLAVGRQTAAELVEAAAVLVSGDRPPGPAAIREFLAEHCDGWLLAVHAGRTTRTAYRAPELQAAMRGLYLAPLLDHLRDGPALAGLSTDQAWTLASDVLQAFVEHLRAERARRTNAWFAADPLNWADSLLAARLPDLVQQARLVGPVDAGSPLCAELAAAVPAGLAADRAVLAAAAVVHYRRATRARPTSFIGRDFAIRELTRLATNWADQLTVVRGDRADAYAFEQLWRPAAITALATELDVYLPVLPPDCLDRFADDLLAALVDRLRGNHAGLDPEPWEQFVDTPSWCREQAAQMRRDLQRRLLLDASTGDQAAYDVLARAELQAIGKVVRSGPDRDDAVNAAMAELHDRIREIATGRQLPPDDLRGWLVSLVKTYEQRELYRRHPADLTDMSDPAADNRLSADSTAREAIRVTVHAEAERTADTLVARIMSTPCVFHEPGSRSKHTCPDDALLEVALTAIFDDAAHGSTNRAEELLGVLLKDRYPHDEQRRRHGLACWRWKVYVTLRQADRLHRLSEAKPGSRDWLIQQLRHDLQVIFGGKGSELTDRRKQLIRDAGLLELLDPCPCAKCAHLNRVLSDIHDGRRCRAHVNTSVSCRHPTAIEAVIRKHATADRGITEAALRRMSDALGAQDGVTQEDLRVTRQCLDAWCFEIVEHRQNSLRSVLLARLRAHRTESCDAEDPPSS